MRLVMRGLFALVLMLWTGAAIAQSGETPPTLDGAKTVTAAEAKALIDKGAAVMDVRRKASFVEGRVPTAKSITAAQDPATKAFDPAAFGANKGAVIIIYGHGSDGWSAVSAVKSAVGAGFTGVHWLRGGWVEWSKAGLPVEQ